MIQKYLNFVKDYLASILLCPDVEKGEVTWLQKVTDEEYNSLG